MVCSVCEKECNSLRSHFSQNSCKLHRQYLENDTEKVKKIVQSFFNTDLPIHRINYKIRTLEFVCTCNYTFIKKTWIEAFGIDEFNKKIKLIERNRVEKCRRIIMRNCKMNRIRFDTDIVDIEKEVEIACYKKDSFKQVRLRDTICQECGSSDRKLDVHHIVPRRLFERYDFEQHDPDNLILLCDQCHSTIGQEFDQIMIDMFTLCIKIMFPTTYESVLFKLHTQKKIRFKRKIGAPKLYNVTIDDINKIKINGIVSLSRAAEIMSNIP